MLLYKKESSVLNQVTKSSTLNADVSIMFPYKLVMSREEAYIQGFMYINIQTEQKYL